MDDHDHWLEVSLVVDGELAEAVADVISRFAANGVVIENRNISKNPEDAGSAGGPLRVFGYLPVDEALESKRQRLEEALWHLGQIQPLPPLEFKTILTEDWMDAWKKHYHPIPIGNRLLVLPAWIENPHLAVEAGTEERIPIRIDPSMAFGTGTHPTTQLSLECLEDYLLPGAAVIDVGCGSGILSIGALKLKASHAVAVDIDSQAVRSTGKNAVANPDMKGQLETGQGSVAEILAGKFSISQAPLVLANILAPVILSLFSTGLADLVAPGGKLVLSGILDTQAADVVAAGKAQGLSFIEQRHMGDWVAIVMEK